MANNRSELEDVTDSRRHDSCRTIHTELQRAIIDNAAYAIIATDAAGTITSFNPAAERLLGYSASELICKHSPQVLHLEEEIVSRAREFGDELGIVLDPGFNVFVEKSVRNLPNEHEWTYVRKDGTQLSVLLGITALRDESNNIYGYLGIANDITQRKQFESLLKASEEAFRTLFDTVPSAVFVCDQTAIIQHYNRRAVELWGREPVRGVERYCGSIRLFLPDGTWLPHHQSPMNEVLSTGNSVHRVEVCIERPDGSRLPVIASFAAIRNANEVVTSCVVSFDDISERKAAEKELHFAKERLELAVRGSFDGLWDWNLQTSEVYFSPRFYELLGFSESDARLDRQEAFIGLIHSDDRSAYKSAVDAHLENCKPFETTTRVRTKRGEWRWFRIRGEAVKSVDGNFDRMAGSISDITQQKIAEEKLSRTAVTDQLTGLPNRAFLLNRLNGAIARAKTDTKHFAVLFLDFDRFKSINDNWGHDIGDELLRQIAGRLSEGIFAKSLLHKKSNLVARLGGDEFVILIENIDQSKDLFCIVENLQGILNQPYQLGKHHTLSSASIGIVIGPSHYEREDEILRDADTAMYEAKQAGRARYVVFDSEMHSRARRRFQLELDLRDAIGTTQLALYYQPVASLLTGEITSVETTLRWQHPVFGEIDSHEFTTIAQDSNLTLRLSEWVLQQSCRQCSLWHTCLGPAAPSQISVNLHRKQFVDPGLLDLLSRILAETNLAPGRLVLEIAHDCFTSDTIEAVQTMNAIKEMGIELAIDDFGVGTASFVTLHQFPVSLLKLDRSLIKQIENSKSEAALLHGLVVMARNLNVKLVANGVELRCQHKAVQELGCEYMQGPYFANPMLASELEDFLSENRCDRSMAVGAMAFAGGWSERLSYIEPASS